MIRLIPIKQYGGLRLEPKPHVAAMQINNYSDEALNCFGTYTPLLVILLPSSLARCQTKFSNWLLL